MKSLRGELLLIVSPQILAETERNLVNKVPGAMPDNRRFLEALPYRLTETPPKAKVDLWSNRIHPKDAPVLAAAVAAKDQYLVTWNTRHFLRDLDQARDAGIAILTPNDPMARLGPGR